ncbi:AraC family transcriptional regulator [Arsenicibacter rosenii]|uniref:HTH araC/xylS-type domain-containing protein n=1 Tax=Arsenicibacter rosenii TaxID=1750698 RepID=A0A1S2VH52_9BACT|nr:AraC family transcriptional regulator [Arsenicibacter rosenii]OIN58062.1 hypothetical protein BLX24_16160 [Arsenicibacter rosenii]
MSKITEVNFKGGLPMEIEVIPIRKTVQNHKSITRPHRATFYHIVWVQQGTATFLIDFEPVQIRENSFLFINKDRVKALTSDAPHDGKILLFTDDFFARTEEDTTSLHRSILFNDLLETTALPVGHLPSLQMLFNEIETELTHDNDAYQYDIVHSLLKALLTKAERERKRAGYTELARDLNLAYTIQFKELLEEQFATQKSVSHYAGALHISEKKLTTATIRTLDKSPKNLIDERVMLEAKRLLVHTSFSVKEIGYELGFDDPTYFVKYFRKHTGKTPVAFRESYPAR